MELYLPPVKRQFNPYNGRFLKGRQPFNKGKRMTDYLSPEKVEQVKKHLSRNGRPDFGGQNKRAVIGLKAGKIIGCYESATMAAERLQLQRRNISHCCEGKRPKCGGIRWFYEADFDKWNKYLQV